MRTNAPANRRISICILIELLRYFVPTLVSAAEIPEKSKTKQRACDCTECRQTHQQEDYVAKKQHPKNKRGKHRATRANNAQPSIMSQDTLINYVLYRWHSHTDPTQRPLPETPGHPETSNDTYRMVVNIQKSHTNKFGFFHNNSERVSLKWSLTRRLAEHPLRSDLGPENQNLRSPALSYTAWRRGRKIVGGCWSTNMPRLTALAARCSNPPALL